MYTRQYQPAYSFSLYGTPLPPPPLRPHGGGEIAARNNVGKFRLASSFWVGHEDIQFECASRNPHHRWQFQPVGAGNSSRDGWCTVHPNTASKYGMPATAIAFGIILSAIVQVQHVVAVAG